MKRVVALLVLAALTAAAAAAPQSSAPAKEDALCAFTQGRPQLRALTRVTAQTLEPVGRRVRVAAYAQAWSFSPDRTRLVLANDRPALRFVDLERMRPLGDVRMPSTVIPTAPVLATAWRGRDRVVAVTYTCCPQRLTAVAVDAERLTVVGSRTLAEGAFTRFARTGDTLVLLVAPRRGIGPTRLVAVDASLNVRTVALPRTRSGSVHRGSGSAFTRRVPGLAIEPGGARAFVVGADEPVAEVDLEAGRVRYHGSGESRTPEARTKVLSGPAVEARWLGAGRLAVAGWRYGGLDAVTGRLVREPLGLRVLDTRTWTQRSIDPDAGAFVVAGSTLVTHGDPRGLIGYTLAGRERFHLLAGEHAFVSLALRTRLYVGTEGNANDGIAVVDPKSGRVVGQRETSLPFLLLGQAGSSS